MTVEKLPEKKKLPVRRAVITVNPETGERKYSEKVIQKEEKDDNEKL